MSGVAAVAALSGSSPGESLSADLRCLLTAMAHRGGAALPPSGSPSALLAVTGQAGGAAWADDRCALGIQFTPRTPEDALERQPLRDPASGCVLVWDGRLDNRAELSQQLTCPASAPDSVIVLRAFLRWREDCAARLLGDFAFAVWDPVAQALYAARDPMGVRPLFYHHASPRFALASELQALLALPAVSTAPDDVMAGEALLWWTSFPGGERTFFHDIRRLPPAHWLLCDRNGPRLSRYWDIDRGKQLRYRRQTEYAEHYAALLEQAVACRLRSQRALGVFLSGGMDSSAVASLAGRLAPAGHVRSYHFQLAADPNDESVLAAAVARSAGIPFYCRPLASQNVLDGLPPYIHLHRMPFADLSCQNDAALAWEAAREGCGAVLTGDGSDELFAFPWAYVGDLLRGFRWLQLARMIGPYAAYLGRSRLFLLGNSLRYAAPRPLLGVWRRLKWRHAPPWVAPEFARRSGLLERLRRPPARRSFSSASTEEDYAALMRGRRVLVDERREVEMARLGMEYRFPFYDRRLLEFMFAVPWRAKVAGSRMKPFLEHGPGLLPTPVRNLPRKANYGGYSDRLWQAQQWSLLRPLFDSPPPAAAAYLHLPAARQVAAKFLDAGDWSQQEVFLRLAVFLLWLQSNDA